MLINVVHARRDGVHGSLLERRCIYFGEELRSNIIDRLRAAPFTWFNVWMKTSSEEEVREELFDSWIVNHINLLSYRHTGVCGDLCGFSFTALLTCNRILLYIHSYSLFCQIIEYFYANFNFQCYYLKFVWIWSIFFNMDKVYFILFFRIKEPKLDLFVCFIWQIWRIFCLFLMHFQFWRKKKTLTFYTGASFYDFIKRKEDFAALTLTWNKSIIRWAKHEKGPVEIITLATRV